MGIFDRVRRVKDMVQDKVNGFLGREVEPAEVEIDAEFEEENGDGEEEVPSEPVISLRFRVTTPGAPATEDQPKLESVTYYTYGRDQEQALGRLRANLDPRLVARLGGLESAKVEPAGHVEDGVLVLPEDEQKSQIFDGRAAPGTPGPVK